RTERAKERPAPLRPRKAVGLSAREGRLRRRSRARGASRLWFRTRWVGVAVSEGLLCPRACYVPGLAVSEVSLGFGVAVPRVAGPRRGWALASSDREAPLASLRQRVAEPFELRAQHGV